MSPNTNTIRYFNSASYAVGINGRKQDDDPNLSRISSDPVLNGLCQLGACRLNTERAFISLIDHEYQYIVSEMTQSISLYDTSRHDPGDDVCLGTRPLDLALGVCGGTMPAFFEGPSEATVNECHLNTDNIFSNETRYVINDFSLEPKYQDRPYVQGYPHMRYYAEVPLKTSLGFVIGTYSLIDNKPRKGLDEKSYLVMKDIAASIMRHIEMVKMQDDYAQASRLLQGLNVLAQDGKTESDPVDQHVPLEATPQTVRSTKDESYGNNRSDSDTLAASGSSRESDILRPALSPITNTRSENETSQHKPPEVTDAETLQNGTNTDLRDVVINDSIRTNFTAAAESLRFAMDLDGVVFLDASSNHMISRPRADGETKGHADQGVPTSGSSDMLANSTPPASSHDDADSSALGTEASSMQLMRSRTLGASAQASREHGASHPPLVVSESLHRALLIHYPHGKIFNFGVGDVASNAAQQQRLLDDVSPKSARRRRKASTEKNIQDQLRMVYPRARSMLFVPLWNTSQRSWFAGCLGWSSLEKRVFQAEDLSYFNIFGNSLMAKTARLELVATDQAKSDFISCISHELRSPLHGILGSTELLRELIQDDDQLQMVNMVEQCGRTLLDTMNHV